MDDSGFRFDVNASLTTPFTIPTTKTEFKNINSLAMLDRVRTFWQDNLRLYKEVDLSFPSTRTTIMLTFEPHASPEANQPVSKL